MKQQIGWKKLDLLINKDTKLFLILLPTLVFFLLSGCSFSYARKEVTLYPLLQFDEGIKYHIDGKLKNAVLSLNNGLNINPGDLPTLIELGQVFTELAKYDLAISTLNQAKKISPSDPLIHLLLGNAYLNNNNVNEAIEKYKLAATLEPENILLLSNIGIACLMNSDYQCTIDNLGKVILAYPNLLKARLVLAIAYHYLKHYSLSQDNYKFILNHEPDNYVVWYNLAKTQIALQDYEAAISSINNAISLSSSLSELYLDRAFLNYKLDRNQEAESDYLLAINKDPLNPVCITEYAFFLWKTGAHLKAALEFDKAISLEPDNKNLLVYKAYLLQLSKKSDEAIKAWLNVLKNEKNNMIAGFNLAKLYHKSGNYLKEIELYQNLLLYAEDEKEAYEVKLALACALHRNNDLLAAKTLYEEILSIDPDSSKLLFNYGILLNSQERYNEAVSYLEKATEKGFEKQSLVYKQLVKSYLNLKDTEKLRSTYKRWLTVDINNFDARLEYAKLLAKIGKTQEAISEYRLAANFGGENSLKALILLANVYKDLGAYEEAITTYKKIISLQHDNYLAYYNLGVLYSRYGNFQEAQNYLLKSVELNEKYTPAYYALGLSYIKSSNLHKAKEVLQKYLDMDPKGEYRVHVEENLREISKKELEEKGSKA